MTPSVEAVQNSAAAVAVTSPFWAPSLVDISNGAGMVLPILGVIWMLLQIVHKGKIMWKTRGNWNNDSRQK